MTWIVCLRIDLYVAGLNWYLRKIISTNKLARTRLDYIVEENFTNGVVAAAWFAIVENGKEGCVKLIVENWISCLSNGAAEARSVSFDFETRDVKLRIVLRVKRWIMENRRSRNSTI